MAELRRLGYEPVDVGPETLDPADDFPDYAKPVAQAVSTGEACAACSPAARGSACRYVANRYPHVRAAVVWSPEIAELSRKHNDANVLVLPSRFMSDDESLAILRRWLGTPFEGGRHQRRVEKIDQ